MKRVPISQVIPNPTNPRIIKDDKFKKLVKSIQEFPQMLELRPIVVDSNMVVLGGNMRLKACIAAGLKEVPIIIADQLTDAQKAEFIIKDNVGFGEWDWDLLANQWDVEALEDWGLELPFDNTPVLEAEEDDYEAPSEIQTDIVLGDLIEIGQHRLLCGDSTDSDQVARLMNGEKADMVFTDPPYNIDYQGVSNKMDKIKNDKMPDEEFVNFIYSALSVESDTFYVCCSWQYSHLFREAMELLNKPVKAFIIWNKVNPAQHLDKYFKQHEVILYHGKFGGEKTLRGDIWEVKREKNTVHPTMKPISLISLALQDNEGKNKVYDAFLGSGSTMVAAHQLNRKCYGMELDPKYCQVIVDRMHKLDPSLDIKINGKPYGQN
jgi:site-specific DNA-methyltransferase (adenine-specific)